jgi:Polysaccharide lyase
MHARILFRSAFAVCFAAGLAISHIAASTPPCWSHSKNLPSGCLSTTTGPAPTTTTTDSTTADSSTTTATTTEPTTTTTATTTDPTTTTTATTTDPTTTITTTATTTDPTTTTTAATTATTTTATDLTTTTTAVTTTAATTTEPTTTTTTTEPTTSPETTTSSSEMTFTGDFETGNTSQWTWGAQCANYGVTDIPGRGNLYLDTASVGQGKYSARIELPATTASKRACEVLNKRTPALGSTEFYGQMFMLPSGWATEVSDVAWPVVISQPNFEALASPGISIWLTSTNAQLVMLTGKVTWNGSTPIYQYNNSTELGPWPNAPRAIPDGQLTTGVWHELIYEIHWASDNTGFVRVWHRVKGQSTWTQTLDIDDVPTFQYGTTAGGDCISSSGTLCNGSTFLTSDKAGAYTSAGNHAITVWQDGYVKGTSFDVVAGRLP